MTTETEKGFNPLGKATEQPRDLTDNRPSGNEETRIDGDDSARKPRSINERNMPKKSS